METHTTQRIAIAQARDSGAAQSAIRWASRLPGMMMVRFQQETGELVVTYDVRRATLAMIRRHLQRGGVACEASIIERFHLAAVDMAERALRRAAGLAPLAQFPDLPLVPLRQAA